MIKYMGRAIAWVQYMLAKPIKHSIKVFCICCAISVIMLAYKIYCGKDVKTTDGTTVTFCNDLLQMACLTRAQGRTLYTDNYYTSMSLAKVLTTNTDGLVLELLFQQKRKNLGIMIYLFINYQMVHVIWLRGDGILRQL
jgi:hypothetical protein